MKRLILSLFVLTAVSFATVTVDGYALLENQTDHSGITVTFERTAPSALTETATTDANGLIGTEPNLAEPHKRMLSSMTPTILTKDGQLFMVTGTPGGRTIINTVLQTILNVVDFGMNAQEATDAPRFHHQWLPDRISYERLGFSADTIALLEARGHTLQARNGGQGTAQLIVFDVERNLLEGGLDRRRPDGGAVGTDR